MYRILCTFVSLCFLFPIHAQSQAQQVELQALVSRVDSLEHELLYLKLRGESSTLITDIRMLTSDTQKQCLEIQLNLYNKNYDSRLENSYHRYYEVCESQMKKLSELAELKRTYCNLMIMTRPFSEEEKKFLMAGHQMVGEAFKTLGKSMEYLKSCIDIYENFE